MVPTPIVSGRALDWSRNCWVQGTFAAATGAGIFASLYCVFRVVPTEAVMGPIQRIFYFHVGAAIASYFVIAGVLFGSALYLSTRNVELDELADSAASVALLLATIVLFSGMIWGHSSWNTWWRWEPRLVSFLVLWLILGSYRILRWFSVGHERERVFAAVMGILSAVNVPIVIYSIRLLSDREQLHPQVVAGGGLRDLPYAGETLALTTVSLIFLSFWLCLLAKHQRNLEHRVRTLADESTQTL